MRAARARAAARRHDCFSPPPADNVAVMASSLRKRILGGYGISLALMAVVLVWAVANLVSLGQASDAILRENYQSILAAENMIGAIERQDSATLLVMLDYEDEGLVQFGENKARFLNWLDRARRNITVPGEADIVQAIETGYEAYLGNFSHLRQMRGQSPRQAGKYYHETVLPSFKGVRDEAARLREINQKAMESASRRPLGHDRRHVPWAAGVLRHPRQRRKTPSRRLGDVPREVTRTLEWE